MKNSLKIFLVIFVLLAAGVFNSCALFWARPTQTNAEQVLPVATPLSAYGTYLAGRVAHIRQDYNKAAAYYIKALELGAKDPDIIGRAYLLLASEGHINEAAKYAQDAESAGDTNNFIHFIVMTENVKNAQYDEALKTLQKIKDKAYRETFLPLFEAWIYAGKNEPDQALKKLSALKNASDMKSLYYVHLGLLQDYFGHEEEADKAFNTILTDENLVLSFHTLQILTNFYTRIGQKDKAIDFVNEYYEHSNGEEVFGLLLNNIRESSFYNTPRLIDSPQKGVAEALFNIGTVFRTFQIDVSQIMTALSLYLNPDNATAQISLADLLEYNQRFDNAVEHYDAVAPNEPLYFMGQIKVALGYMQQHNLSKALDRLKNLEIHHPDNYQVLFNLAETYRMLNRPKQAIQYYQKALKNLPEEENNDWTLWYALGMAYEQNQQWPKAESALQTALQKSNRHPIVLNYLGYTWLKHNQNSNEALYMIFDAYNKSPENGHIIDSLGWALYRMGKYDESIKVLERASEYLPGNAVVYDHLGDAYWQGGRHEEARFQWQHALDLKEDAEALNKEIIRRKIESGAQTPATLQYNESLLVERLKDLNLNF